MGVRVSLGVSRQGWKLVKRDQAGQRQARKGRRTEKEKVDLNEVEETTMR